MNIYLKNRLLTLDFIVVLLQIIKIKNMRGKTFNKLISKNTINLKSNGLMSIAELSIYLDLTVSYIYRLTSGRKIPYYQPLGKKIYFDKEEIDKWIREKRVKTQEEIDQLANKTTKF
jgi:excisionase family DNA binding protein